MSEDRASREGASGEPSGAAERLDEQAPEHYLERIRIAEDQRREVLAAYQRLKRDNERFGEDVTSACERRYLEGRDRLLVTFTGTLGRLDQALAVARDTSAAPSLIEGLQLVRSMLHRTFQDEGLELIRTVGLPYDPKISSIGGTREVEDPAQHGVVVEELQRGLRIGDRIAQPATVIVGVYHEPAPAPLPIEAPPPEARPAAPIEPTPAPQPVASPEPREPPPPPPEPEPAPAHEPVLETPAAAAPAVQQEEPAPPEPLVPPPHEPLVQPPPEPEPLPVASPPPPAEPEPSPIPAEAPAPVEPTLEATLPGVPAYAAAPESPPVVETPAPETPPAAPELPTLRPMPTPQLPEAAPAAEPPPPPPARPSAPRFYLTLGLSFLLVASGIAIVALSLRYTQPGPAGRSAQATPRQVPRPAVTQPGAPITEAPEATVAAAPTPEAALAPPTQPAAPAPPPKAPPTTLAAPPATLSPADEKAQRLTGQVSGLMGQAEAALAQQKYDIAVSLYDEALALDPQNAAARAGKSRAASARDLARRSFVAARTSVVTAGASQAISGFDSTDVDIKKAPRDAAAIEFEASPAKPQAGEPFAVKVYVANTGKKTLKVAALTAVLEADGARTGTAVTPRAREVEPGKKALIHELAGVWREGAASWSLDVTLTTQRGETFRSSVAWR